MFTRKRKKKQPLLPRSPRSFYSNWLLLGLIVLLVGMAFVVGMLMTTNVATTAVETIVNQDKTLFEMVIHSRRVLPRGGGSFAWVLGLTAVGWIVSHSGELLRQARLLWKTVGSPKRKPIRQPRPSKPLLTHPVQYESLPALDSPKPEATPTDFRSVGWVE